MIIRPLRCLPPLLYERVTDLQNINVDWQTIIEDLEIEFDLYLDTNHDAFSKWFDVTRYSSEILNNFSSTFKKYGYKQIDIFGINDDRWFKLLNERGIEYICIDDYTKNMFVLFIKEADLSKSISIIGCYQYEKLSQVDWCFFDLYQLSIAEEIAKNKNVSKYNNDVYLSLVHIIENWVDKNNITFYFAINGNKIYFERECDAALFKITFV